MVQTTQYLNGVIRGIFASLLLEILEGEIRDETRRTIAELGDLQHVPEPYHHLLSYTQGASMDGVELADDLLDELLDICAELQEQRE